MLKKGLSVLLAFVLIISVFTILPVSFSAEEVDVIDEGTSQESTESISEQSPVEETIADEEIIDNKTKDIAAAGAEEGLAEEGADVEVADTSGDDYPYSGGTIDAVDRWRFYTRECTSFCAWRLNNNNGVAFTNSYGGVTWGNAGNWISAAQSIGISVDNSPAIGSIACWTGGKYGHVAWVSGVDGDTVYIEEYNYNYAYNYGTRTINRYNPSGYIHIKDIPIPDPTPQGHVMSESEGAGKTIPDGDYWIISKIAEDYFVDIPGNDTNTQDGCNVQAWVHDNPLPSQYDVFHFEYLNNGFYKITQLYTNMAIDVYGADLKLGSNVSMWTYNGTNAQQWSIEKTDGGYRIRSRCNNYYMDINDGKHDNGTNILVWESHDGNNQRFSFIPYAPDEKPVSNGIYEIRSAVNKNAFLDAIGIPSDYKDPTNIDIWNGPDGEKFQIEYAGNGYYFISEVVSGLVLDLNNDGEFSFLKDGRNVNLCTKNNKKNQLWKIKNNSDGTYCFINQMSGYYLDLENSNTDNGTNVSQFQYNGNNNQKWRIYQIGHEMSESEGAGHTIPDGDYWIESRVAQDFFVDIPGNDTNTQNGCNVQAWVHNNPLPSQYDVFHFEYLNNGFYRITQRNTEMCLQVEGSSMYCGTNVHMWEEHGSLGAEWSIERSNIGYKIRSRCNNYYLDINDGKHDNGTNILVWENNDANNQRFSFIPYSPDEKPLSDGVYMMQSAVKDNLYLDAIGVASEFQNTTNIDVWNGSGDRFRIEYAGDGWYRIYETNSNLLLEIRNTGTNCLDNSANAMLYERTDSKGQLWKIRKNSDGTYSFINQMSGYYLDLEGANTENGANVSQYQYNDSKAQKWLPARVLENKMLEVGDVEIYKGTDDINPDIQVAVDNITLSLDIDYTVSITSDVSTGQGTVTITGINNYCGSISKSFTITVLSILGDADGDGEVSSVDATLIQRYGAMMDVGIDEAVLMNADVDDNGELEIVDATWIQRYLAYMDTPYAIGEEEQ